MAAGLSAFPCRCLCTTPRPKRHQRLLPRRAAPPEKEQASTVDDSPAQDPSPRGKSGPRKFEQAAPKASRPPPPLPDAGNARWPEGQLLPDGWERMDPPRKATEFWLGKRGVLFWLNKVALGSVIALAGGWVLFRFVGPALGLYELKEGIGAPPNL